MSDPKQASLMLSMAQKDLKALKGMMDPNVFEEEIFGFHIQQAIEKALKAWLALLGVEYPLTHDLSVLLNALQDLGADVSGLWDLVEYNTFAVRFRYEFVGDWDQPLDRDSTVLRVEALVNQVEGHLQSLQITG
ncbi:MAG: HEPN domain-containing protein [Desulfomonile tiedjei]|nr:HEPN domain-containing protein [Desulfomonile tiedjei]